LIFTYKDTNFWRDYQLFQAFSYPELAYWYRGVDGKHYNCDER